MWKLVEPKVALHDVAKKLRYGVLRMEVLPCEHRAAFTIIENRLGHEKKMCDAFEAGRTAVRSSSGAEQARNVE